MRLRPNDSPPMELNEKRRFTLKLDGAVGANTLSNAAASNPQLTLGTPSISGKAITLDVTATKTGTHMVKVGCDLSNGEKLVGVIRVKVCDSTLETNGRDYG